METLDGIRGTGTPHTARRTFQRDHSSDRGHDKKSCAHGYVDRQ